MLNPTLRKDSRGNWWIDWTSDPNAIAYDIVAPNGSHVQAGKGATNSKLGKPAEPFTVSIAPAYSKDYESVSQPPKPDSVPDPTLNLLWEATTSAPYGYGSGGGWYNSGNATNKDVADGIQATITTPSSPTAGVRGFRWAEPRANRDTTIEAVFTIPQKYVQNGSYKFWNIFEYKSRTNYPPGSGGRIDPLWAVYVDDATGRLCLGWGWGGTTCAGPYVNDNVSGKWYKHQGAAMPIGKAFTIKCRLYQSNGFDGKLQLWQDSDLLFDLSMIRTSYNVTGYNSWNCSNEWAICHYSDGLNPSPASITFNSAKIWAP